MFHSSRANQCEYELRNNRKMRNFLEQRILRYISVHCIQRTRRTHANSHISDPAYYVTINNFTTASICNRLRIAVFFSSFGCAPILLHFEHFVCNIWSAHYCYSRTQTIFSIYSSESCIRLHIITTQWKIRFLHLCVRARRMDNCASGVSTRRNSLFCSPDFKGKRIIGHEKAVTSIAIVIDLRDG